MQSTTTAPAQVLTRALYGSSRERKTLSILIGISAACHIAVVGAWALAGSLDTKPAINPDEAVVHTRLVALGTQQPQSNPRRPESVTPAPTVKTESTPTPTTQATSPTSTAKMPDPDAAPTKNVSQILDQFEDENQKPRDLSQLIGQRFGNDEPVGDPQGSKSGTEATGNELQIYLGKVHDHVKQFYDMPPLLTDDERVRLRAKVLIRLNSDGTIKDVDVKKSSGNNVFDETIVGAIKKSAPLPIPPPSVVDTVARGINVDFRP